MSTRTDLLKLLSENTGVYLSGQKIGEELQVSRNAVWKAMQQLKNEGYHIESKPSTTGFDQRAISLRRTRLPALSAFPAIFIFSILFPPRIM